MSDNIYLAFLAELAFALAVILLLVSLILRRYMKSYATLKTRYKSLKRQIQVGTTIDHDSQQEPTTPSNSLKSFIQRQRSNTQKKQAQANSKGDGKVWQLRQQFLQAEAAALKHSEDSDAYWDQLDQALTLILQQLSETSSAEDISFWKNKVDLLRDRLAKMKSTERQERFLAQQLQSANETIKALKKKHSDRLNQINSPSQEADSRNNSGTNHPFHIIQKSNLKGLADTELIKTNHSNQREVIDDLKNNISSLMNTADEKQYHSLKNKVDELESQLDRSETYSSALESELIKIRKNLEQAQHNLDASEIRLSQSEQKSWGKGGQQEHRDTLVISSSINSEQLNDFHDGYQRANDDISEINKVIEYQRSTITGLEDEISKLRNELLLSVDPEESEEKARIIERLERLLTESETCVSMLESEVETLREKLHTISENLHNETVALENIDSTNTSKDNSVSSDEASKEIQDVTQQLNTTLAAYDEQARIIDFAMNCLKCRDINELARDIMESASSFEIDAGLIIRSKLGSIESIDPKIVSQREKVQLKSIPFDEKNLTSDTTDGFIITFPNISLLVKPRNPNSKSSSRLKNLSVSLLSLASHAIKEIENSHSLEQQKKTLTTFLHNTQKTIKSLDIQYSYQCDEVVKINDRLLSDLYIALESMKISDNQRKIFERMMNESQERMSLLFASGLSVDESMKKLISSLEEKASS